MKRFAVVAVLIALCPALAGCGGTGSSDAAAPSTTLYLERRAATLQPGDPVPTPVGPVVLTVAGRISRPNVGDTLQFDLDTLERLGTVSYEVDDNPAEGRRARFDGVLLLRILEAAGAPADATKVEAVALNDYRVDLPISDLRDNGVMAATSVDGERMTVDRFGPVRVVYPNVARQFDPTEYEPRWIWQLSNLTVT